MFWIIENTPTIIWSRIFNTKLNFFNFKLNIGIHFKPFDIFCWVKGLTMIEYPIPSSTCTFLMVNLDLQMVINNLEVMY